MLTRDQMSTSEEGKTKEIKVHLGFMPEEVASVLKPIINSRMGTDALDATRGTGESVLIISRGDITDDLFEQFVSNFGISNYSETASTLNPEPGRSITDKVAYSIGHYLESADIVATLIPGAKTKMLEHMDKATGKPKISVGRIGTGPVTQICIQLPEMGFQSDLAATYTMGMLDAIAKHALDPSIPVTVSSYGGGGSAHQALNPGEVTNVGAVLNLRNHIDLEPQVDFLIQLLKTQEHLKDEARVQLVKLQEIKDKMERKDRDLHQNDTQNDLVKIRRALMDYGISPQALKMPADHPQKFYCEISISDPQQGKEVFYRTASYPTREEAEEVGHLVFLRMGNVGSPSLTANYINMLKNTRPEYRALIEQLDPEQIQGKTEDRLAQAYAMLETIASEKIFVNAKLRDTRRNIIKAQLSVNNALTGSSSEIPTETHIQSLKEQEQQLSKDFDELEKQEAEIDTELEEIKRLSEKILVNEAVKAQIEDYHRKEINSLMRKGDEGYWATPSESSTVLEIYFNQYEHFPGGKDEFNPSNPYFEGTRKYLQQSLTQQENEGFSHNFASSMFVGAQTKGALMALTGSDKEVIADVNMEDDIIADIIHMIVRRRIGNAETLGVNISQFAMARVHCDPFTITPHVEDRFKQWCKQKTCNKDYYVSAIMWGLQGFDLNQLDAKAKWDFAEELKRDPQVQNAQKMFFEANGVVIDPFWREIATDFLADIEKGVAFTFPFDPKAPDKTPESKLKVERMQKAAKEIKGLTRELMNKKAIGAITPDEIAIKEKEIKTKTEMLVFNVLSENQMITNDGKYKVWARGGSWMGNKEKSADSISFNGAAIDRAFYVSSNMTALTSHGLKIAAGKTEQTRLPITMVVPVPGEYAVNTTKLVIPTREVGNPQTTVSEIKRLRVITDPQHRLDAILEFRRWASTNKHPFTSGDKVVLADLISQAQNERSGLLPTSRRAPGLSFSAQIHKRHISGPRALRRIQEIQEPHLQAEAAKEFLNWANKHHRSFNPEAMREIQKIATGKIEKDSSEQTVEPRRPGHQK